MFITKLKHNAIVDEKNEALVGLVKRLNAAEAIIRDLTARNTTLSAAAWAAEAKLKPFRTYRRGADGRFVGRELGA